ncbi:MAG: hypothetical protein EPO40_03130 [Myxococcaceae bacterium]|nr:MAG: hypothetical protein EPO40_03130 [Myxococcaceae bacterium]
MSTVRGKTLGDGNLSLAQLDARYSAKAEAGLLAASYFFTASPMAQTTATTGSGTLRLLPWVVRNPLTIVRLGAEVTVVGDAGSKYRLGIYADTGTCFPGALVLDAGQIAGDSATVQELTISQALQPGLYWVGGVAQSVTTTQPTMRTVGPSWTPPVPLSLGASIPGTGAQTFGFLQGSVTGALPANFTSTATISGTCPRLFVKAA